MASVTNRLLSVVGLARREVMTETDPRWIPLVDRSSGGLGVRASEQIAAVHACIDVISSALAALPPVVRDSEDRAPVTQSPLDAILARPNKWQTWPDFVQWYVSQCLLHGNALAVPENGELTPIPWPTINLSQADDGQLVYGVQSPSLSGRPSEYRYVRDVLHMRDRSDDGLVGRSRLQRSGQAVAHAQTLAAAASSVYSNGITPSLAISVDGRLSPAQRAELRAELRSEMEGVANRGKALLLDQAARVSGMDTAAKDMELLESRRFSVIEICRLYEVPPPLAQDYTNNTFTNASIAGKWFAQFTLSGWAAKFEHVMSQMLPPGLELSLDMSAFSRGDVGERWNAYDIALRHGVIAPERVADMEGWA